MTTPTGSLLVAAFERAWDAIQARNPEVPDVVFVSGGGLTATTRGIAITWGHFGPNHWNTPDGKAHELFVSGESLSREPHETMTTLLHEAAHALSHVRGIKDTSRRNAYHNRKFVAAAEELGLEWPKVTDAEGKEVDAAPDKTRGFSAVRITDATREEYADTIAQLEADKIAWRDLMGLTFGDDPKAPGGDDGNGGDGEAGTLGGPRKPRSKNTKPKAICKCDDDSAIWVSRKVLEEKRPMCGICRTEYVIHPDWE